MTQEPDSTPATAVIVGATGFIGSAVLSRLRAEGYRTVACLRSPGPMPLSAHEIARIDLATATEGEWRRLLQGADLVVNCAGLLQDGPAGSTRDVHVEGPARLFAACEAAGVKRVIHFSAIGVDRETPTDFSSSKRLGDEALIRSSLNWVILRPSVVVSEAAYGGSALFRGLAALPWLLLPPRTGKLQVVQRSDVVDTVAILAGSPDINRVVIELAGPDELSLDEIVRSYRLWLGWGPQRIVRSPEWLAAGLYRLGDFAGWLGWRPPVRSTARTEIVRGAVGDNLAWTRLTGITPRSFHEALRTNPPSVQERWFARLYVLKPAIFAVLSLFWIGTGLMSLGPGWDIGMAYMRAGGAADIGPYAIVAGALADILIGIGIAVRRTARFALLAAIVVSLAYAVIGTIILPTLWLDPLGPMLKIWPIIGLLAVALAIHEDR